MSKAFSKGQEVFVVFGHIEPAKIVKRLGTVYDRYEVEYKDGTKGDPCDHLIYASRKDYYEEVIENCKNKIAKCEKRLKEKSLDNSLP